MPQLGIFSLKRRDFLSYLALSTFGLLAKDLIYPVSAMANSEKLSDNSFIVEKYHAFVPYITAKNGGQETVLLRSGESCPVIIPSRTQENQEIIIKGKGQDGKDISVVFHTLYDRESRIANQIYQEIDGKTQFIQKSSKDNCKSVYEQIEDGEYIDDVITLNLLDYVIGSSELNSSIQKRFEIASTNSRLLGIRQAVESTLAKSSLTDEEKNLIRGTYAYVRAGEPVPDFKALTDLDSIVNNSALPLEIKQTYSIASTNSRALTVDFILVKFINNNQQLKPEEKENYLLVYKQIRDGKKVDDENTVNSLYSLIAQANISLNAKVVYSIASEQNSDNPEKFADQVNTVVNDSEEIKNKLKEAQRRGAAIIPHTTKLLSVIGTEAATGVSISSLSGAAATNATLAVMGGGSVAAGGLGMLGGLAVATGGAALIGAAGLVSIALVSEMDNVDRRNLGIAVGTGTIAGAASVLAAWTAASALGVTGTLSGAAAITTTISALGGLSLITGGAAFVASGAAFLIWSLLKGGKKRDQSVLHQLETRSYTLTENPQAGSLGELLQKRVREKYNSYEGFSAPYIPLDQLSKALSTWLSVHPDEKVLALIDTSIWNDAKAGVVFTNQRLVWKSKFLENPSFEYEDLAKLFNDELLQVLSDGKQSKNLSKLKEVAEILSNEQDRDDWVKLLQEVSQTALTLQSA